MQTCKKKVCHKHRKEWSRRTDYNKRHYAKSRTMKIIGKRAMDLAKVRRCVQWYREIGLSPLPSREDRKSPALSSYAQYFEGVPIGEEIYRDWNSLNVQLITGTRLPAGSETVPIIVVDLDGGRAGEMWFRLAKSHNYEPTGDWVSHTGGGGTHLFFSLDPAVTRCPSGRIWGVWDTHAEDGQGDWLKHQEIRILGDGALVIAPPSIHVETGKPYHFDPEFSPKHTTIPERAPQWLLDMPRLTEMVTPVSRQVVSERVALVRRTPDNGYYSREEVLEVMRPHLWSVAASWGVVPSCSGYPNSGGWVSCYVPWRENPDVSTPSGSFNIRSGVFVDMKDRSSMTFFDLGARMLGMEDWVECKNYYGDYYIGSQQRGMQKYLRPEAYGQDEDLQQRVCREAS